MHHFRVVFCAFRKGFRSARVEPLASEATFLSDRIGVRDSSPPCFPRESSPAPPAPRCRPRRPRRRPGSPWRPAAPARPPPDPSGRPRGRGAAIRPAAKAAGALEDDRRFGRIAELPRLPEVLEEPKIENLPQKLRKTRQHPQTTREAPPEPEYYSVGQPEIRFPYLILVASTERFFLQDRMGRCNVLADEFKKKQLSVWIFL